HAARDQPLVAAHEIVPALLLEGLGAPVEKRVEELPFFAGVALGAGPGAVARGFVGGRSFEVRKGSPHLSPLIGRASFAPHDPTYGVEPADCYLSRVFLKVLRLKLELHAGIEESAGLRNALEIVGGED